MQYSFATAKEEMKKVEERLKKEYSGLHTGRATPAILDGVYVDAYGSKMQLSNVGSISIEDPKTLRVSPWDKSLVKETERAIAGANLGLSVATDESGLRVIFPSLTTESRQRMVKILKEKLEEARISTRKVRETIWSDIQEKEKEGKMSEDEKFRGKDELQKIVDETNKNLEKIFGEKENEVMS